jgi:hypothetical protein
MQALSMKGPMFCQFMQMLYGNKITNRMFPEAKLHSVINVEIMSFWLGFVKVGWMDVFE